MAHLCSWNSTTQCTIKCNIRCFMWTFVSVSLNWVWGHCFEDQNVQLFYCVTQIRYLLDSWFYAIASLFRKLVQLTSDCHLIFLSSLCLQLLWWTRVSLGTGRREGTGVPQSSTSGPNQLEVTGLRSQKLRIKMVRHIRSHPKTSVVLLFKWMTGMVMVPQCLSDHKTQWQLWILSRLMMVVKGIGTGICCQAARRIVTAVAKECVRSQPRDVQGIHPKMKLSHHIPNMSTGGSVVLFIPSCTTPHHQTIHLLNPFVAHCLVCPVL